MWRSQILRYVPSPAGGADYWLAWIKRESGGNPCSYTSLRESGLFQLMPPDNTARGGTTEALLRAACAAGQTQSRPLTDAEVREQMVSFSRYLAYITDRAREKLAAAGVTWSESSPDFWKMVKFQHTLPAPTATWLAAAKAGLGRPPRSWNELVPFAPQAGIPAKWVENASWVGSYGGGGEIPILIAALAAGAGLMYYLWRKRR
jgi:hypothetical protein